MQVHLHRYLFFHVTYLFIVINILIANYPNIAIYLLGLRDSWIFILLYFIVRENFVWLSLFIVSFIFFGIISIAYSNFSFVIFIYGFRDICFVALFFYFLDKANDFVSLNELVIFLNFILFIAGLQLLFTVFNIDFLESILKTNSYFNSKGVYSNLNGGFIRGVRLTAPFYSSSLVATFLSYFLFFTRVNILTKFFSLIIILFSLSKVFFIFLFFYFFRRRLYLLFIIFVFGIIIFINFSINNIRFIPIGIFSFHISSIYDHLYVFKTEYLNRFTSFFPEQLGYFSNYSGVVNHFKSNSVPESLILSHFMDMGVWFLFPLIFVCLHIINNVAPKSNFNVLIFISLIFFSSLSNQPVIFLPFFLWINFVSKNVSQ